MPAPYPSDSAARTVYLGAPPPGLDTPGLSHDQEQELYDRAATTRSTAPPPPSWDPASQASRSAPYHGRSQSSNQGNRREGWKGGKGSGKGSGSGERRTQSSNPYSDRVYSWDNWRHKGW